MAANGYIKIFRSLTEWEWYTDGPTVRVFLHLLLSVNWKDAKLKGITIKRGSMLTSYEIIGRALNLSKKQVRRALENLEKTKNVARQRALKGLLVTVENFDRFQLDDGQQGTMQGTLRALSGHFEGTHRALCRAPNEEREECKEEQEGGERARACARGPYGHLSLTDGEVSAFLQEHPADGQRYIDELDEYMEATGKTYKNSLAALNRWARNDKRFGQKQETKTGLELALEREGITL